MNDDQFTTLFKYVEDFRREMNEKLTYTASQEALDRLTNSVDAFVKRLDDKSLENKMRDRQFDRLLVWAKKVSEKTGIPLEDL